MSLVGPFSGSGNRFGNLRLASALILASLGLAKVIHHFYFSQQKGIPPEEGREEKEEKVKSKKSVKMSNPAATDSGGDTLGTKAETSAPMSRKERSSSVATVGSVDSGTNNWNDLVDEEDMENEVAKETMEEKKSSGTVSLVRFLINRIPGLSV